MTEETRDESAADSNSKSVYNASLIFAFVANFFQMIGISLLFRYSDFVESIGGTEWHLGFLIGTGAIGAIVFRIVQGKAVDRIGAEWIWLLSLCGQLLALFWHLQLDDVEDIQVYLARLMFATSVAGNFGAWLSFISLQAPKNRMAEVIGVVGSSGFLGMAIGPSIGDVVFARYPDELEAVRALFIVSGIAIAAAFLFAIVACVVSKRNGGTLQPRQQLKIKPKSDTSEKPAGTIQVLFRYQPGLLLVIGVLMGMTIGFPANFLRPWAKEVQIEQIKIYFITYNLVAFVSRMMFRRAPQILGLKNTISLAWGFMAISMLLYLPVQSEWMLCVPAAAAGLAHSFLFPSVVAACSLSYPVEHRGMATNLILAMYDTGVLIGMPAIGMIVTMSRKLGLAGYPTTFCILCGLTIVHSLLFYFFGSHQKFETAPDSAEVHH